MGPESGSLSLARVLRRARRGRGRPLDGLEALLWRAVSVFRIMSCTYAGVLTLHYAAGYATRSGGYAVIGVMACWSALSIVGYARRAVLPLPLLLGTDLAVTLGCLLATRWIVPAAQNPEILPMLWVASAALAWGVVGGLRAGTTAAVVLSIGDVFVRDSVTEGTLNLAILVVLPGALIGYVADLAIRIEEQSRRATRLEAATVERERLARAVHDSVLQVLALVQRRGAEIGGPAVELGRLAGEQERALRALVSLESLPPASDGAADLCGALRAFEAPRVTLALPATPIPVTSAHCAEITAAVRAALDNVTKHTGPDTRAWILVEEAETGVVVTVRDDGPGIAPGRLAQAETEGRLGFAQSIRKRIEHLGGSVAITASPGQGTEIELRVPAAARDEG